MDSIFAFLNANLFVSFVLGIVTLVAMWRVFSKAGYSGWYTLVPVYNTVIFL